MMKNIWRLGAILGLLSSVGPLAIDMYLPTLPTIATDLGTTISASQASILVFLIAMGLGQLVYGPMSDQYGRKLPLYIGLGIFVIGSLSCALATDIQWLVISRFLQGAGAAAMSVIPRAVVRDQHTGPTATRLMSTIMIVVAISPLCAPLVGSGIILVGSWRLIFVFFCISAVLGLALTKFVLVETLEPHLRRTVNLRSLMSGAKRLVRHPQFMLLSLVNSCGLASFFVYIASSPFVYTETLGLTPTQFSIAFSINAAGFFGASQFAAPLAQKFGSLRLVSVAIFGFAVLTSLLVVLSAFELSGLIVITGMLFFANACLGLVIPTASVLAIHDQGDIAGLASSVGGAMQWATGGVAILLIGPFFDGTTFPMTASIAACGILALLCAILAEFDRASGKAEAKAQ